MLSAFGVLGINIWRFFMKKLLNIFLMLLVFFFVGCASYIALPKDDTRFAHNRIKKQEKTGLILAAEDYSEYRKCRRYFYRDLLDAGYIPIYLCIGNKSTDGREFTIRTENIVFRFEDGSQAQAANVKDVIDESQSSPAVGILAFPLGIFPAFLIAGSISQANDELDQDYSQKAFRDSHIAPGDNLFGFLFFKVPEGKEITSIKDATLEIKAARKAVGGGDMAETVSCVVSIEGD